MSITQSREFFIETTNDSYKVTLPRDGSNMVIITDTIIDKSFCLDYETAKDLHAVLDIEFGGLINVKIK